MFRLLRYFSVASLLSIAVAAVLLGAFYRHVALGNLSSMGEQKNVALAHALSNAMRAETEALLAPDDVGSVAPAHTRECPPWILELIRLADEKLRPRPCVRSLRQNRGPLR